MYIDGIMTFEYKIWCKFILTKLSNFLFQLFKIIFKGWKYIILEKRKLAILDNLMISLIWRLRST